MTSKHIFDSDHQPQGSQPEAAARDIPLAAPVCQDSSLHILRYGEDTGLRIWLDVTGGIIVHVDEHARTAAKGGD